MTDIIASVRPRRPWAEPGQRIVVVAEVGVAVQRVTARLRVVLLDLDREVGSVSRDVMLTVGPREIEFELQLPGAPRHGYGLRLEVTAAGATASAVSAVEALTGWWESPRHAAITDYRHSEAAAVATRELARWHVNVVQHYDWMWRHYRYLPPSGQDAFEDALGRTVSHAALEASVTAGHEAGIASLAYGSVYGAEPEHVQRHPDDRVFDEAGQPLSLGGAFFINDIRPGSAWRGRLLDEYITALKSFAFDGIHMDTYGEPHTAVTGDGAPIEFAELYPGLIGEAAEVVAQAAPGAHVLFNCVDGFPLAAVASAPTAALYLELWPPDDRLADVVRWIDQARALADGRQVVIAAYAATFKDPVANADRASAFEPVLLLGSVIAASGAYHHTLAAADHLLVEGYYPAAVPMVPLEIEALRALWRFGARYLHLLSDPGLSVVEPPAIILEDADGTAVDWSTEPVAGSVWVRETVGADGQRVLHLIDLRDHPDTTWTEPKDPTPPTMGLGLCWEGVRMAVAMSPWAEDGDPVTIESAGAQMELPSFRRWLVVAEA